MKDHFKDTIRNLITSLNESSYPETVFDFESDVLSVHMRVPPPHVYFKLFEELSDVNLVKRCAVIEEINIADKFKNQGLFNHLVTQLLNMEKFEYVIASNVTNKKFSQHLNSSKHWVAVSPLIPGLPEHIDVSFCTSYYTSRIIMDS